MMARETEFYHRQAERLQRLAEQCVDAEIRKQVAKKGESEKGAAAAVGQVAEDVLNGLSVY
jgi:hypothetical protein